MSDKFIANECSYCGGVNTHRKGCSRKEPPKDQSLEDELRTALWDDGGQGKDDSIARIKTAFAGYEQFISSPASMVIEAGGEASPPEQTDSPKDGTYTIKDRPQVLNIIEVSEPGPLDKFISYLELTNQDNLPGVDWQLHRLHQLALAVKDELDSLKQNIELIDKNGVTK